MMAIFCVYSGWQVAMLLLIAVFALAGQWEFYRAQEEKGHKVFKQSGLFCGALIFLTSWYFLIENPAKAHLVHLGIETVVVFSILGALIRLVVRAEEPRAPITTAALDAFGPDVCALPFQFHGAARLHAG